MYSSCNERYPAESTKMNAVNFCALGERCLRTFRQESKGGALFLFEFDWKANERQKPASRGRENFSLEKLLSKIKSIHIDDIILEINKHQKWLDNFKNIWELKNRKVLKLYLLSKKVRFVVLFQEKNWNYIPFYIVKKETKNWFNISSSSLDMLNFKLDNIINDLEKSDYKIIE